MKDHTPHHEATLKVDVYADGTGITHKAETRVKVYCFRPGYVDVTLPGDDEIFAVFPEELKDIERVTG